jgi:ribosomal protein S18 acetylase RimI-like enzyme
MALSVTDTDQLTIRTATCEDAPALAEFAERSFRETFGCDNVESDMAQYVAHAFGDETQRAELADSRRVVLLAEIGGVIAGYAQLMNDSAPDDIVMERPVIEIERFYVAHEWHGRGIAQQLMACATEAAIRADAATLWLAVWERNPRAMAFYRKSGFVDVGSRLFLLGSDRQTDRVMSRLLRS